MEVKDLKVSFFTPAGEVKAVGGISYDLDYGEVMGVVGESGSGKSVMSQSILRLRDHDTAVQYEGEILFENEDLLKRPLSKMREIRGNDISVIFQDPLNSLSPVHTVGKQLSEIVLLHKNVTKSEAKARSIEMLKLTGIPNPEDCMKKYPFELSGGMQQRVMIAMALACEPDILIADEPTTALDVTIQAQILELMQELQKKMGMAIIMVTHDLGVIADMCDEIIVMYGGRVCERGTADDIFYRPAHEYTKGLLRSIPTAENNGERLVPIGGTPINLLNMPRGCAFCPRCDAAMKICLSQVPEEIRISDSHLAACFMNVKKMFEANGEV